MLESSYVYAEGVQSSDRATVYCEHCNVTHRLSDYGVPLREGIVGQQLRHRL